MELEIKNEFDPLSAVLMHRPGDEIDRLTHHNMHRFLFEDIPYLKKMQAEHDAFASVLRDRGVRVYYLEQLLLDLFATNAAIKGALVEAVVRAERLPALGRDLLDEKRFSNEALVQVLFSGLTQREFNDMSGRAASEVPNRCTPGVRSSNRAPPEPSDPASGGLTFLLPPIPNAYFSRDPAVVVGRAVISCKMHYGERVRETLLARVVLEHHPELRGHEIAYGGSDFPTEDRPYTIEGGDVLVLNEEAVLVGASQRTRSETIQILADNLFEFGHTSRFYEIPIPTERTFMHLDTVLTIVDRGVVVWFPGVMERLQYIHHYEPGAHGEVVRKADPRSLKEILSDEFGREVRIIRTGGGDEHYAVREQRTDGTNTLAIAPRVVCTYERNVRTIAAMEQAGIECLPIEGSELVRGLGGPRCMTMPLRRTTRRLGD